MLSRQSITSLVLAISLLALPQCNVLTPLSLQDAQPERPFRLANKPFFI